MNQVQIMSTQPQAGSANAQVKRPNAIRSAKTSAKSSGFDDALQKSQVQQEAKSSVQGKAQAEAQDVKDAPAVEAQATDETETAIAAEEASAMGTSSDAKPAKTGRDAKDSKAQDSKDAKADAAAGDASADEAAEAVALAAVVVQDAANAVKAPDAKAQVTAANPLQAEALDVVSKLSGTPVEDLAQAFLDASKQKPATQAGLQTLLPQQTAQTASQKTMLAMLSGQNVNAESAEVLQEAAGTAHLTLSDANLPKAVATQQAFPAQTAGAQPVAGQVSQGIPASAGTTAQPLSMFAATPMADAAAQDVDASNFAQAPATDAQASAFAKTPTASVQQAAPMPLPQMEQPVQTFASTEEASAQNVMQEAVASQTPVMVPSSQTVQNTAPQPLPTQAQPFAGIPLQQVVEPAAQQQPQVVSTPVSAEAAQQMTELPMLSLLQSQTTQAPKTGSRLNALLDSQAQPQATGTLSNLLGDATEISEDGAGAFELGQPVTASQEGGTSSFADFLQGQRQQAPEFQWTDAGDSVTQLPEEAAFDKAPTSAQEAGTQAGTLPGFQQTLQNVQGTASAQSAQATQQPQTDYDIPQQIVDQARLIQRGQETEMVIHLKPEHLGDLTLRVSVGADGAVNASFHSSNAEVRTIIENTLVQLKQDLNNQGIKVDNVGVYAGLADGGLPQDGGQQQAYQQQGSGQQHSARESAEAFEDEQELAAALAAQKDSDAATDGVDYRV